LLACTPLSLSLSFFLLSNQKNEGEILTELLQVD
jgi:hypothetical protein